jgi:hypothetical protein
MRQTTFFITLHTQGVTQLRSCECMDLVATPAIKNLSILHETEVVFTSYHFRILDGGSDMFFTDTSVDCQRPTRHCIPDDIF